jgi:hypothetical protein
MAEAKLFGYADKISVKPGDEITFRADAVIDCHSPVTARMTVPDALMSGVYAVRLSAGAATGSIGIDVPRAAPPRR